MCKYISTIPKMFCGLVMFRFQLRITFWHYSSPTMVS